MSMVSSIATLATALQQEKVQQEAGTRVAKMAMDSARTAGEALVDMLEVQQEVYAHLGSKVDTRA